MRWKEEGFSYESDPINHFKRVKADKELFLEMASTLRESGVKDVDVYAFIDIDGEEKFFDYMKNKMNGSYRELETKPLSPKQRQRISGWSEPQMHVSK